MKNPITVLVVEDEMIIAAKISLRLANLGYEVTGLVPRGEEALMHIEQNAPDIVLLDINLKGDIDGIQTAEAINASGRKCVIIYLTANADEVTFNKAKTTRPFAFLSKPVQALELQRTLELTVEQILKEREIEESDANVAIESQADFLNDRIFVKHKNRMVKIFVSDILYLEADRSYCQIVTKEDEFTLSVPLKNVEDKLSKSLFMRIHRSYLVNIKAIDEMTDHHVYIASKPIPINSSAKEDLLKRLQRV